MNSNIDDGRLGARWPFFGMILAIASIWLAFTPVLPGVPRLLWLMGLTVLASLWSDALTARLARVGLSHPRWLVFPIMVVVITACAPLYAFRMGQFVAPILFVILHVPLALLPDKPQGPKRGHRTDNKVELVPSLDQAAGQRVK
jgi:hypothetical protein